MLLEMKRGEDAQTACLKMLAGGVLDVPEWAPEPAG